MKQLFLIKKDHSALLLFFAGWGMDESPFTEYHPSDCDFMICYDYRTLDFDYSLLEGYLSIRLVAWSMGVWVASQVFGRHSVSIDTSVAVNGTIFPVNQCKGIAPVVFWGTLEGLNEASLARFYRRMCGTSAELASFLTKAPHRTPDELKEELRYIGEQATLCPASSFAWSRVLIGIRDKIFPAANQLQAWKAYTCTQLCDMEHYSERCFREVFG